MLELRTKRMEYEIIITSTIYMNCVHACVEIVNLCQHRGGQMWSATAACTPGVSKPIRNQGSSNNLDAQF